MLALAATGSRYGYHRDELYFLAAGAHPAFGYPDQPLLTPLLAHALDTLAPGSLLALRAPSILAGGVTVTATGLIARELGGERRAQVLAGACWAVGAVCLVTGHLLSTTTGDVCATAVASLLIARVLRTGDTRWWVPAGAVVGVALLNKSLIAIVIVAVLVMIAALGPRAVLRSRWLLTGGALALLGALPYTIWQLAHGVPQTQLASSIAASGAEGGRGGFIPFQLLLIGPLLAPVWVAGLAKLLRDPSVRAYRCFAAAYLALVPLLIIEGGKAYYMAGLYPMALGAGSIDVARWAATRRVRVAALWAAVAVTGAVSAVIGLAVLPPGRLQGSIVIAVNPDAGEMVGWPRFVGTVAAVYRSLGPSQRKRVAIFTSNYGEAGAIAHFGPALSLPYPYSGHNGWTFWGPPPNADTTALLIGIESEQANRYFLGCTVRAHLDDGVGLKNQEQGEPVWVCTGEREPWSQLWPKLRHYN